MLTKKTIVIVIIAIFMAIPAFCLEQIEDTIEGNGTIRTVSYRGTHSEIEEQQNIFNYLASNYKNTSIVEWNYRDYDDARDSVITFSDWMASGISTSIKVINKGNFYYVTVTVYGNYPSDILKLVANQIKEGWGN